MEQYIDVDVYDFGTDKPTDMCIITKPNGRVTMPVSFADARRYRKEGSLCSFVYVVQSRDPKPGEYVMDCGHVYGPYEAGDHLTNPQGTVIASSDPELGLAGVPKDYLMYFAHNESIRAQVKCSIGLSVGGKVTYEPIVDDEGFVKIKPRRNSFTKEEVYAVALDAMNMGMNLRQDQLNGYCGDKSGKEILNEWLDDKL